MTNIFDTDTLNDIVPAQINYNTPQSPLMRLEAAQHTKSKDRQEAIGVLNKVQPEFVYLESRGKYYNTETTEYIKPTDVGFALSVKKGRTLSKQELIDKTNNGEIPCFKDVCYNPKGMDGYYNTFDPETITKPSNNPRIHEGIKFLIENLTHGDQVGIEWLHQCILYKYTHLDDVRVPCVVFYDTGGSGKGIFVQLLTKIFGSENVMENIDKYKLESQFDAVKGDRLIYEFAELTTNNGQIDKGLFNKIKSMIFAPKLTVNEKFKGLKENVPNYGWFTISSNSTRPILLDSADTGNRRFTFFRSQHKLTDTEKDFVLSAIEPASLKYDNTAVADYIEWLYKKYPQVVTMTGFDCLENDDKALVVQNSESKLDEFVRYLKEEYPYKKIWVGDVETAINAYQLIYGNCDAYSLKGLFENYSPFVKKRGIVEGRGNVWHYIIK